MYTSDKEAIILEHIYYNASLKQRELADKAGISLGMVNAILRRLIEKGWLMTKRINSRNINYVVSPAGVEEIFKRGYRYFKRTIDDVILYKEAIEQLVNEAVAAGYNSVALVGKSDLAFIIEYACEKSGVSFKKVETEKETIETDFCIYGEHHELVNSISQKQWLQTIIMDIGKKKITIS